MLWLLIIYFNFLIITAYIVNKKNKQDNLTFFRGKRKTPWYIISIGMISSSISGISLISVPGMVQQSNFAYMQMVFGFFVGYIIIAYILLPLYYKLNLISIYGYLNNRFGKKTYKTGVSFFLLAKLLSTSTKLYLVAFLLHQFIFIHWDFSFVCTCGILIFFIWLYSFRNGISTIIWTDFIQTLILVLSILCIIIEIIQDLNLNFYQLSDLIISNSHNHIFVFDDWTCSQNFFKYFFSGIFITIVMTGLDQDMMQKNLSCKTLQEAKKNIIYSGISFIPINFLLLILGFLIIYIAQQNNLTIPLSGDEMLPAFINNNINNVIKYAFILSIIVASFSSADSALTALTTCLYIDIFNLKTDKDEQSIIKRKALHIAVSICVFFTILIIQNFNTQNCIINILYKLVSYSYGPLLGLFFLGLFSKQKIKDSTTPIVAIISPLLCFAIENIFYYKLEYQFGYELLILNATITTTLLLCCSKIKII